MSPRGRVSAWLSLHLASIPWAPGHPAARKGSSGGGGDRALERSWPDLRWVCLISTRVPESVFPAGAGPELRRKGPKRRRGPRSQRQPQSEQPLAMMKCSPYTKGCFLEAGFLSFTQEHGGRETKELARAGG